MGLWRKPERKQIYLTVLNVLVLLNSYLVRIALSPHIDPPWVRGRALVEMAAARGRLHEGGHAQVVDRVGGQVGQEGLGQRMFSFIFTFFYKSKQLTIDNRS